MHLLSVIIVVLLFSSINAQMLEMVRLVNAAYSLFGFYRQFPEKWNCVTNEVEQAFNCFQNVVSNVELNKKIEEFRGGTVQFEDYNLVIEANSLLDLGTPTGWYFNTKLNVEKLNELLAQRMTRVCLVGDYDQGKSWLLNKLTGRNIPHGYEVPTRGLSIIVTNDNMFVDTAGSKRGVRRENVNNRLATDTFVQKYALHLCDIVIAVLGPLQLDKQKYFDELSQEVHELSTPQKPKDLYFVHNFQHYVTENEVNLKIKEDIIDGFSGERMPNQDYYVHVDPQNRVPRRHVVLAMDESVPGKIQNPKSIELLKNWIRNFIPPQYNQELKQILKEKLELNLPDYFYVDKPEKCPKRGQNFLTRVWDGIQHRVATVLGFFSTPMEEETLVDPFQIVYDETCQCMRLVKQRELHYFPLNSDGVPVGSFDPQFSAILTNDKFILYFDLPGFKLEQIKAKLIHGVLTLSGFRCFDEEKVEGNPIMLFSERKGGEWYKQFILPKYVTNVFLREPDLRNRLNLENGVLQITLDAVDPPLDPSGTRIDL